MKRLIANKKQPKKRVLRVLKVVALFLVVVFVLEIWMVNRLSTYGKKIEELKVIEANLQLENQVLENSIAQRASLGQIEEKSTKLGFGSIKNPEYIKSSPLAAAN